MVTTALVLLAVHEGGRTRWLLVVGAVLLAGGAAAGALTEEHLLVDPAGWLGRIAGVLLLAAAAMSAVSATPGRSGVRLRHRRAEPSAGVAAPAPASVPAAGPREQEVPA